MVDAAALDEIGGLAVVRAETEAVLIGRRHHRDQRREVARDGALANHDHHAQPQLLEGFCRRRRLVIRLDARRDVRLERSAGERRGCGRQ